MKTTHSYIPVPDAAAREGWKSTVSDTDALLLRRVYDKMRMGVPDGLGMNPEEAQSLTEDVQIVHASHPMGLNLQNLLMLDWDEFISDVFDMAKYKSPETGLLPSHVVPKCGYLTPEQADHISTFQVKIAELERDRADLIEKLERAHTLNRELRNTTERLKRAVDKLSAPSHFKLPWISSFSRTEFSAITGTLPKYARDLERLPAAFYEVNKVERMRSLPPSYVFMVPDKRYEGGARCVSFGDKRQAQEACEVAKKRAGK